jgi:hypothetical protein
MTRPLMGTGSGMLWDVFGVAGCGLVVLEDVAMVVPVPVPVPPPAGVVVVPPLT